MKTHSAIGYKILKDSAYPGIQMAASIAYTHHERWDGRGYPRGLREEEIPIECRIVMLVDQYDALRSQRPSREDELSQARKIANQLAIAIANSILVDDLEKLAKGTIEALARTVDAKSKWTSGHSERVAIVSGKMGRAMGLAEKKIETLIRGGMLHDIGKIGVPIAILDKPRKLSSEEYEEVKHHPAIGAKILEPIEVYQDILPIIAQHHERFDGSGYPLGLVGERIDIRARIMAVADVWDALVSDRPYRQGWAADRAKQHILEGKGTLLTLM